LQHGAVTNGQLAVGSQFTSLEGVALAVLFSPRMMRIARFRVVTMAAGLVALAFGLLLWSAHLGALGGMLVLLGCGLFAYEVRLPLAGRPLMPSSGCPATFGRSRRLLRRC
jgi:hypothetical protein